MKTYFSCVLTVFLGAGCATTAPNRQERLERSYIYYLDGAGGAGLITNWSRGVRSGLLDAGYDGAGEVFKWQTGLGVVADQDASVEYKRGKARELAGEIVAYKQRHPQAPVHIIGLSAGTAVAVYALEELPEATQVESVILLSSSISSDYDLTGALEHVRDHMYVFTSERDAVLRYLVPIAGTADRESGVASAGLEGFKMPRNPSAETRTQYDKLVQIGWREDFARYGYRGSHTGVVKAPFVRQCVAPLVMGDSASCLPEEATAPADTRMVENPTYQRWRDFGSGSWARFEGYQVLDGRRQDLTLVSRLESKDRGQLTLERVYEWTTDDGGSERTTKQFFAKARIPAKDDPRTHPASEVRSLGTKSLVVAGKTLVCTVKKLHAPADFDEWGSDIRATIYMNNTVPGGIVRLELSSHRDGQPFTFFGELVQYMRATP